MVKKVYSESEWKCLLCGEEYISNPSYCDESLECAMDEGESLVAV
jgi:hypothetical protein